MQNTFRVQLVYKNTNDVHAILLDNVSLEEASKKLEATNSGMEVDTQIMNFETGEVIETK